MNYYAHTAEDESGKRLPEQQWQPLARHLCNVAKLAKGFGCPLGIEAEAEFVGSLHDLGKYRLEFQRYLRGECPSSFETQHAVFGAAWAFDQNLAGSAFAAAGHHAGLHDCADLQQLVSKSALRPLDTSRDLMALLTSELGPLPVIPNPPAWVRD